MSERIYPQQYPTAGLELRRFIRANASTLSATGVEWAFVAALVHMSMNYLIAAALGALLGAVMDFSIKRHWAFMRRDTGALQVESARYLIVSAFSLFWNLAVSYVLVDVVRMPPVPGILLASVAVGAFWNYPLHRLFVFPDSRAGA
jgi:putative flippase GtrA